MQRLQSSQAGSAAGMVRQPTLPPPPAVLTPTHCSSSSSSNASCSNSSTCSGSRLGSRHVCRVMDPILDLATDPSALQDVIVGGAVTAAVGAALYSGLKQEPVPCDLCAGNGGIKCFACSGAGNGSIDLIDPELLQAGSASPKRFSRSYMGGKPGSCRVCKGQGLVLCSKCKGSGYMSTF